MKLTGEILRSARGYCDLTRAQLAQLAGVSAETIKSIEMGRFPPREETTGKIMTVFTERGIVLTEEGVSKKPKCPKCGE